LGRTDEGRHVGREIAISLGLAVVLALAIGAYLVRTIDMPKGPVLVAQPDARERAPDDLELASSVAGAFVAHLRARRFDDAYAMMARSYRARIEPAAFRAAWTTSPLLAGLRDVRLTSARSEAVRAGDGRLVAPATFTARGALIAAAGSLDATFTFLREDGGARVLVVAVGGVPVVNGVR
jgi:hypothetical protein